MARPAKSAAPDLSQTAELTVGVIERLTCPAGKAQAFLRDAAGNGLRVRVTPTGAKSFVFEARVGGKNLRKTIGAVSSWTIPEARVEARRLAQLVDSKVDPRELERQQAAEHEAEQARQAEREAAERIKAHSDAVTVADAWAAYVAERSPHWGIRHVEDHHRMTIAGGVQRKRAKKGVLTVPGPLAELMPLRLMDLDGAAVTAWAQREAAARPARVRLALRILKAFLRWCAESEDFAQQAKPQAAGAKKAREAAGKPQAKDDVLERGQLAAWFKAVQAIPNPTAAAYVQVLLLTGARPGEVQDMKWDDVNWQWDSLTIRDKVEGERTIPLTPCVRALLHSLPRRNAWVFASTRVLDMSEANVKRRQARHAKAGTAAPEGDVGIASESGRLADPGTAHRKACAAVGLEGLTLHGLRRSFASLTEWLEIPAGVVAQLQGHKPSATAEKHYKRRPLDLLRVHHQHIERWILEQAGIELPAENVTAGPALMAVK